MFKYFYRTVFFYIFMFALTAIFFNLGIYHYSSKSPAFYKWIPHGTTVWIKPKFGRQIMPDKKLEKLSSKNFFLFSNSPESFSEEKLPCYVFRAYTGGYFRILLHHQNMLGINADMNIIFVNNNNRPVYISSLRTSTLEFRPDGRIVPSLETMSSDPAVAGRNAFIRWLLPQSYGEGTFKIDPGEKFVLPLPFNNGETLSFMSDFLSACEDGTPADVTVVVAVSAGKERFVAGDDILSVPLAVDPLLHESSETIQRVRGYFDYTELRGEFSYRLSEISYAEIASATQGIYSSCNPGEYYDSLPSPGLYIQKAVGNFGVVYFLDLCIINDTGHDESVVLMASAAGGRSLAVLKEVPRDLSVSGDVAAIYSLFAKIMFPDEIMLSSQEAHRAWIFENERVPRNHSLFKSYIFSLPCGCNGPIRFYAVPLSKIDDILMY